MNTVAIKRDDIYDRGMDDPGEKRRRKLLALIRHLGLEKRRSAFAEACGFAEGTIRAFLSGTTNSLRIDTYEKIEKRFGASMAALMAPDDDMSFLDNVPRPENTRSPELVAQRQELKQLADNMGAQQLAKLLALARVIDQQ